MSEVLELQAAHVGPLTAARVSFRQGEITLVAGRNEAGKSTLALMARTLLSRVRAPISGKIGQDGTSLLELGLKKASACLSTKGGSVTYDLPGCTLSETGDAPEVLHPLISGLQRFGQMTPADRAQTLDNLCGLKVTAADLKWWLGENGMPEHQPDLEAVIRTVESKGWEVAADGYTKLAQKARARWEDGTGQTWGEVKGQDWRPEGWQDWLEPLGQDRLDELAPLIEAKEAEVEAAVAAAAVAAAAGERLADLELKAKLKRTELAEAETHDQAASLVAREAYQALKALPNVGAMSPQPCPSCGTKLGMSDTGHLCVVPEDDQGVSRLTQLQQAHERARVAAQAASERKVRVRGELNVLEDEAKGLREQLAKAAGVRAGQTVELVRQELADLRWESQMIGTRLAVDQADQDIRRGRIMAKCLGPEGVRFAKLKDVLGTINDDLATISTAMGLPAPLRIADDMAIWRGRVHYALMSESAKWRADVAVQLALAKRKGAQLVVMDGADILDTPGRNGLLRAIWETELTALVTMTFGDPARVPDLTGNGMGISVWLADGAVSPIKAAQEAKREAGASK